MNPSNEIVLTPEQKRRNQLKACIFLDVLNRLSINEAYETRREKAESIGMEYMEFDFWYHQFYNGNHDLDYKKNIEQKSRKFTDLPIDILAKLLGEIRLVDKLSLRQVTPNLQHIVDSQFIECKKLSFGFYDDNATLYFDYELTMVFKPVDGGCKIQYNGHIQFFEGGHFLKMAVNLLLMFLKQPKLELERLVVGFHLSIHTENGKQLTKKCLNFIASSLKSLNHQIHVKFVTLNSNHLEPVLSILPFLKAGTLESIDLYSNTDGIYQTVIDKLMELSQWKQAKKTDMKLIFDGLATEEEMIKVRDVFLKSSDFSFCKLVYKEKINFDEFKNVFRPADSIIRVPNTDKAFLILYKLTEIFFHKK